MTATLSCFRLFLGLSSLIRSAKDSPKPLGSSSEGEAFSILARAPRETSAVSNVSFVMDSSFFLLCWASVCSEYHCRMACSSSSAYRMQSPVSLQDPLILPRIPPNAFRSPGYWRSIVFATDSLRGIIASTDHERTVSNMVFKMEKAGFVSPAFCALKSF